MSVTAVKQGRVGFVGKNNRYRGPGAARYIAGGAAKAATAAKRTVILAMLLTLLTALGVGLLFGYRLLTAHPYFAIREISVEGNKRLTYGEILSEADLAIGRNSLSVNVADVEGRLSRNPWVAHVSVKRKLPGAIEIRIAERQPCFWVRQGEAVLYADGSGRPISQVSPGSFASLPMVEAAAEVGDVGGYLPRLTAILDRRDLPFSPEELAWVKFTERRELEMYLDRPGLILRVEMDDFERQLPRLRQVWDDLRRRGELSDAGVITAAGDKVWVERRRVYVR